MVPPSCVASVAASRDENRPRLRHRPTIAVLLDYMNFFGDAYESHVRRSFDHKCRELDVDLLLFYGRALNDPRPGSAGHNAIFDLAQSPWVDGVVAISGCLTGPKGTSRIPSLLDHYRGLPRCSVGVAVPGVPSLVIDSQLGILAAMDHLIEHHGRRRIAFIAGTAHHPEAERRFEGYRECLLRHGLGIESDLIEGGCFMEADGYAAAQAIIGRGAHPDAIMAANDVMALGAMRALREQGIRVPSDVSIVGFDDILLGRLANPPLTTVAQPFDAMAEAAIRALLAQLDGDTPEERIELPTQFVRRHSCGCDWPARSMTAATPPAAVMTLASYLTHHGDSLVAILANALGTGSEQDVAAAHHLVKALRLDSNGEQGAFLSAVEDLLAHVGDDNERYAALQDGVTALREQLRPFLTPELHELWDATRNLIATWSLSGQTQQRLRVDEAHVQVLLAGERLSVALDLPALRQELLANLPRVGVETAFLSRYLDEERTRLEPFACLLAGMPQDPAEASFPPSQLVPSNAYQDGRRHTYLVFPLVFETQHLGVAVFEYAARMTGYPIVRDQISAALRSILLHQEVLEKRMLHERSVQERLATSKRMESLSVLAGGVAHDLNNALEPLVALPDLILRELSTLGIEEDGHGCRVCSDILTIKHASLRAVQTIKDLMTLGVRGRSEKVRIELNRTVAGCLTAEPLLFLEPQHRRIEVNLELNPEPILLYGSQLHVERAVSNLIRNAAEAITASGSITVRTATIEFSAAFQGYETVPPGSYAVVAVSDTGEGIPAENLNLIFEPFFTTKNRAGGGSGLGLAIVHGVVKDHQGFVDVVSTSGQGTTFRLFLPLEARTSAAAPQASTTR